jgi:hypothetical protein
MISTSVKPALRMFLVCFAFCSRGGTAHQAGYDNDIFVPYCLMQPRCLQCSTCETKAKEMAV